MTRTVCETGNRCLSSDLHLPEPGNIPYCFMGGRFSSNAIRLCYHNANNNSF